ncbi:MAG: DNA polymerase III subunit delta [Chloroflexota bacterium]
MNSPGGYVYILYGDPACPRCNPERRRGSDSACICNTFGRDEAVQGLKDRMRSLPAGEHNLTTLGPEATVTGLRMAADVAPFLADRRMVVAYGMVGRLTYRGAGQRRPGRARKNAPSDSGPDEFQMLLDYLPDLPQTTSLVLVEDGKPNIEPLIGAIAHGRATARGYARVADVSRWVRGQAKQLGVDIDEPAVRELASLGGGDLRRLDSELRKLGDYAAGRTVTRGDVRELVIGREAAVWALLDGLAERNTAKALSAFRALCSQGESTGALFGRDIVPHYHRLLVARELSLATTAERARVDVTTLGMNPTSLSRWMEQAARFDRLELEHAIELLLDLDRQIKVGETEAEPSIEVAIVQLCTRLSPSAA